jgi:hypothetical protein
MPFITQGKTNLTYILIIVVLAVLVGGGILGYYYSWIKELDERLVELELKLPETKIQKEEALDIAQQSTDCSMAGILTDEINYNAITKTWWINLERMPELEKDGCNPACVISEKTRTAEVNWRCTGLIESDETTQKQEVEQVHLKNLEYYLAGDAENLSSAFSKNYIDWGLGSVDMSKENLEEMFLEERFKQLEEKIPEEIVDLDNKIVLGYTEILKSEVYESFENRHGFHFQEGDVFISFPSELIPDGFFGVYRKENGIWKIIISD